MPEFETSFEGSRAFEPEQHARRAAELLDDSQGQVITEESAAYASAHALTAIALVLARANTGCSF